MCSRLALPMVMFTGLALGAPAPGAAQVSWSIAADHAFDSTTGEESASTGRATAATLSFEHLSPRLRFFSDADIGDYAMPGSWQYLLNETGATFHLEPLEDGTLHVYTGASGTIRLNGDDWGNQGFRGINAFANAAWLPREAALLRVGYRLDRRWFPDASEFDHVEHGVFGSARVSLPSRTTLIGEAGIGAKAYASGPGGHARRVDWLARVAQSLADRTGVFAQVQGRDSAGAQPSTLLETPVLFFDDGVYDDPFAHDLAGVSFGVTHLLRGGAQLSASAGRRTRDFANVMARDLEGAVLPWLRSDAIAQAGASLRLPLYTSASGVLTTGTLGYSWTRSTSNDPAYSYRSHQIVISASVGY